MAKKRRLVKEEPEEEYEFKPTEFDEREFILSQMYSTKVLFIVILIAIGVGILTAAIVNAMGTGMGAAAVDTLIVFFIAAMLKKILMAIGMRADLIEARSFIGTIFVYLVMCLGICILFINVVF
ncbi:hypothetical protein TALC_00276 [Thermoplasmatales archaeon BRNA1]|nr:hypothetical protein TALC_00276 [Thermoplasmatales archaeon BRNA1]